MFLSVADLIILGIGSLLVAAWILLVLRSRKYDSLFEGLDEKEYQLKDLYSTGYAVMELIKYDYKSKYDRKLRQELEILYDKKYADYYLRVTYARALTYFMLLFLLGFPLYGLSGDWLMLFLMTIFAVAAAYYIFTLADTKIKKRSAELLHDFSEVISKLALLTNAGMILKEAWITVSDAGEGTFYDEMKTAVDEMNNGISEIEAIRRFGVRCVIPEAKKFSSTVVQGLQKGNAELSYMLQEQSQEVWAARKQNIRREGEKASSKLMIPIFIMFFGIIIMVVVPIFANIGA